MASEHEIRVLDGAAEVARHPGATTTTSESRSRPIWRCSPRWPGDGHRAGALLLCISSPYARRGALWEAYDRHYGKDGDPVLVWQADTRSMNGTVAERIITQAHDRDEAAARVEYGAEFRHDIESFVAREAVEACVIAGRLELAPVPGVRSHAFVDLAGGGPDSMTLAIAHRDRDGTIVLDCLRERRPPCSPEAVVAEFAAVCKAYRLTRVRGDRYAGEWPREAFRNHGISYGVAEKAKSDLYRELLPLLNSGRVALLDHPRLIAQLCGLERRTARGGRDSVDHGPKAHDDLANAVAAALGLAATTPLGLQIYAV